MNKYMYEMRKAKHFDAVLDIALKFSEKHRYEGSTEDAIYFLHNVIRQRALLEKMPPIPENEEIDLKNYAK